MKLQLVDNDGNVIDQISPTTRDILRLWVSILDREGA
jgi:hypothetical protein